MRKVPGVSQMGTQFLTLLFTSCMVLGKQRSHADPQQPHLLSPTVRTNYSAHACPVVGALETVA